VDVLRIGGSRATSEGLSGVTFVNMKFATVAAALLPMVSAAGYSKAEYKSGKVMVRVHDMDIIEM
jgi:hypothetical protein